MDVTIRGKNLRVTDAVERRIRSKFARLSRYLEDIPHVQVLLVAEKEIHEIEVTIPLRGGMVVRAEASGQDVYAAVDIVLDKLAQRLKRYREQVVARRHAAPAAEESDGSLALRAPNPDDPPDPVAHVARVKRFLAKPMTLAEAALQMELIGHDFFVFRDVDDDEVHVMYRRREGDLGVLVAER